MATRITFLYPYQDLAGKGKSSSFGQLESFNIMICLQQVLLFLFLQVAEQISLGHLFRRHQPEFTKPASASDVPPRSPEQQ